MQSNNHEAIQKIPSEQLAEGYKELEKDCTWIAWGFRIAVGIGHIPLCETA